MSKFDAHICDGGCGERLVVDTWGNIHEYGWLTTFTPKPQPTLYACSATCMIIALRRVNTTVLQIALPVAA